MGIAIRRFSEKAKKWECFLQFYDFDGNLLQKEVKIPEVGYSSYNGFYLDSNGKDKVYILEINEEVEPPQFIFFIYKIIK